MNQRRCSAVGLIFIWLASLTGCATAPSLNTPTGRPEVVFENTTVEEVKNLVTNAAISWGYSAKSVTDYVAVYEKRSDNAMTSALLGSRYDSTPVWRVTFSYVSLTNAVRVVADIHAVTNPGSAFERITDFSRNSQDANNVQRFLENAKEEIATRKLVAKRGKVGIGIDENLKVIQVLPGSPAEGAGVLVGDRIVEVDGVRVLNNREATLQITGEPGSVLALKIDRNGTDRMLKIIRGQP